MAVFRKLNNRRGFTLVELLIAVAILSVLLTLAITNVLGSKRQLSVAEYNNNAESIAVAAQSRLTELNAAGDNFSYEKIGVTKDGDIYIASNDKNIGNILPRFSIDTDLWEGFFIIGYQQKAANVFEVFYFAKGANYKDTNFADADALETFLAAYRTSAEKREADGVGYYKVNKAPVVDYETAGAHLPTPQITIDNYEELGIEIYLPNVKQLPAGVSLGFEMLLVDKDEKALAQFTKEELTVYSTLGRTDIASNEVEIKTGETYKFVFDTPREIRADGYPTIAAYTTGNLVSGIPTGRFETWAELTRAYYGDDIDDEQAKINSIIIPRNRNNEGFKLGDDVELIVNVFATKGETGGKVKDPLYIERSAKVTFNGWFDSLEYKLIEEHSSSADEYATVANISCGRHLQNLAKLTEMRSNLRYLLPVKQADGTYTWGAGDAYSYVQSSSTRYAKYLLRNNVNADILGANQLMPVNFDNDAWYNLDASGNVDKNSPILFEPISPVEGFCYFGNYYAIRNLNVHTDLYAGLFGYTYKCDIYDVRLVNPSVESDMPLEVSQNFEMGVGGLIGTDRDSSHIYNCQVYLEMINGEYDETRRVSGNGYVAGLIGFCEDEVLRQCSASVFVGNANKTEDSPFVGGLIGGVTGDSNLKRCYAAGVLRGQNVGGLVGAYIPDTDYSGDSLIIESCYTAGNIEHASVGAGGLIGYTRSEQRGYEKSAVRAHQNYCAVIYGEGNEAGTEYNWTSITKDGEIAPIYGTFEGDGFVWLSAAESDIIAEESEATDYYRVFAGGFYDDENYNYYIAQKGINYAHSSLWQKTAGDSALVDDLKTFVEKYKTADTISSAQVDTMRQELIKHKFLQVLQEVRDELDSILADAQVTFATLQDPKAVEYQAAHPGETIDTRFYIDWNRGKKGKVDSHSPKYPDTSRRTTLFTNFLAEAIGNDTTTDTAKWWIVQLENLINGKSVTVNGVTYTKDDATNNFKKLVTEFALKFFSDKNAKNNNYYWPNDATNTERGIFSEGFADIREYFEYESYFSRGDIYSSWSGKTLNSNFQIQKDSEFGYDNLVYVGTSSSVTAYSKGDILVKDFSPEKNFQNKGASSSDYLIDNDGNIVFKRLGEDGYYLMEIYKDRVDKNILEMLYSLYNYGNINNQYSLIDNMNNDMWVDKYGSDRYARSLVKKLKDNKDNFTGVNIYSNSLKDYVTGAKIIALVNEIFGSSTSSTAIDSDATDKDRADKLQYGLFKDLMDYATRDDCNSITLRDKYDNLAAKLDLLYKYFDKAYDYFDAEKDKAEKAGNSDDVSKFRTIRNDMSSMMSYASSLNDKVKQYSRLSYTGGVENALDKLYDAAKLKESDPNFDLGTEITRYITIIETAYTYDSGHPLYNLGTGQNPIEQLKEFTMEKTEYDGKGTFDRSDWYGYKSWSTYKYDFNEGFYTVVFPYHEKGNDTAVYPLPMIVALELWTPDDEGGSKVTPMLFHYGDWLTPDLWATAPPSPAVTTLNAVTGQISQMTDYFTDVSSRNSDLTGNGREFENLTTALNSGIDNLKAVTNKAIEGGDAYKTDLETLKSTINGWLNKNGAFDKLEAAVTKHQNGGNADKQALAKEILAKITEYKVTLNSILKDIEALAT